MELVVTTAAIRRAKLHSNRYHQQTNFLQAWMLFLSPNQQCRRTEGKSWGDVLVPRKSFCPVIVCYSALLAVFSTCQYVDVRH